MGRMSDTELEREIKDLEKKLKKNIKEDPRIEKERNDSSVEEEEKWRSIQAGRAILDTIRGPSQEWKSRLRKMITKINSSTWGNKKKYGGSWVSSIEMSNYEVVWIKDDKFKWVKQK